MIVMTVVLVEWDREPTRFLDKSISFFMIIYFESCLYFDKRNNFQAIQILLEENKIKRVRFVCPIRKRASSPSPLKKSIRQVNRKENNVTNNCYTQYLIYKATVCITQQVSKSTISINSSVTFSLTHAFFMLSFIPLYFHYAHTVHLHFSYFSSDVRLRRI